MMRFEDHLEDAVDCYFLDSSWNDWNKLKKHINNNAETMRIKFLCQAFIENMHCVNELLTVCCRIRF